MDEDSTEYALGLAYAEIASLKAQIEELNRQTARRTDDYSLDAIQEQVGRERRSREKAEHDLALAEASLASAKRDCAQHRAEAEHWKATALESLQRRESLFTKDRDRDFEAEVKRKDRTRLWVLGLFSAVAGLAGVISLLSNLFRG